MGPLVSASEKLIDARELCPPADERLHAEYGH
jgi:hypothetical protein